MPSETDSLKARAVALLLMADRERNRHQRSAAQRLEPDRPRIRDRQEVPRYDYAAGAA